MAQTTTASLNSNFPDVFEKAKLIYEEETLMPRLVTRRTANTMASRILTSYNGSTAGTVAEGAAPTAEEQTKTADGTITPYIVHVQAEITDEDEMTDPDGALRNAWDRLGRGVSRKVDSDLAGLFASADASKGTAGSAITVGHLTAAMAKLDSERAGIMGRFGVFHPFAYQRFAAQLTGLQNNPINGSAGEAFNEVMRKYYRGDWVGISMFLTNAIGTGTAASNAVFNRDAIIYDVRTDYATVADRNESKREWLLNAVHRCGAGIDRQEAIVEVIGLASEPS